MIASGGGSNLLYGLAPFVLLIGFWIFLMRRVRGSGPSVQQDVETRLTAAEDEIRRLRHRVEELESSGR